jgi:hypothetical protein
MIIKGYRKLWHSRKRELSSDQCDFDESQVLEVFVRALVPQGLKLLLNENVITVDSA